MMGNAEKIFHAVSLSGGKDSTAMLLLMIERDMPIDMVLTADTGMEFPEMYEHLAKLDKYLYRERGIHLTTLRHPKGFEYLMFEEEKQKPSSVENRQRLGVPLYGNGWPGVKVRWCTGQLKTHLISKEVNRLKGDYHALHYVGIAADEPKRIKNEQYPLVDWGITEAEALKICYDRGYDWGGLYEISINIVIQNMAQLKKLFKDSWENVTGNCDTLLYLGGNEASTHEYISKMLGKATIDTRTRGVTKGRSGSSSTNYQNAGRELLMPDEVRMLDNRKALIFIRGERPVMDDKYPIQKHPNYCFSADGGQPPYEKRFDIPCYERNDLSHEIDIENLEILEETQNEEENHAEPRRTQPQGKAPLLHRCVDLRSLLRHLYARFRRR